MKKFCALLLSLALAAAVALLAAEGLTVNLVSIWFAVGAVGGLAASWLGASLLVQFAVFDANFEGLNNIKNIDNYEAFLLKLEKNKHQELIFISKTLM